MYEGLPNVLIEALISGAACVSADCPSGPREILAPETDVTKVTKEVEYASYGVLMPPFPNTPNPDKELIASLEQKWVDTLSELLNNEPKLQGLRARATERGNEYDIAHISKQWEQVINKGA